MDTLKIFHDPKGRTLTIWFDDPEKEHASEETGDELIIIKDQNGHIIGLEHLNYEPPTRDPLQVELVEA